jgi:Protein of unknown function (DUF3485)
MSSIQESGNDPARPAPSGPTNPSPSRRRMTPLAWAAVACILLGSSAVVRAMQDRRHRDEASYLETCPFPLDKIPTTLGGWRMSPEGDKKLDSMTMRITGGTDHILRTYADDLTGVKLDVLILFGPVEPVIPHTPEVCFPANGFTKIEDPITRPIKDASGEDIKGRPLFRSGVYQKSRLREGVYHSFRLGGQWSPDIGAGRKFPRRNPGVFKIQVQRMVAEGERRGDDNVRDPLEQFLGVLIPEIERLIDEASAKDAAVAKAVAAK